MNRHDFAGEAVRQEMSNKMWTHDNCYDVTEKLYGKGNGVYRPGKTAYERARRERKKTQAA